MTYPIAVDAIDFVVRAIGKIGGIKLVLTFSASEALFVVGTGFSHLLLSIKYHTITPGIKV